MENSLIKLLNKFDILLSKDKIEKLEILKKETISANEFVNLTSISETEFDLKMIIDCLIFINEMPKEEFSIIDVGSGAGFPGLVVAICLDNAHVTCLEATNKKCQHISKMIKLLNLNNVTVVNKRAEDFVIDKREAYDFAIARGLKSLNILVELLAGFVKTNGDIIALKSLNYLNEINECQNAFKKLNLKLSNVLKYDLDVDSFRAVLFIKKFKKTSNKYPRQYKDILKKPL